MASCGTIFQELLQLLFKSDSKQLPSLHQLNDSVYEFYSPPEGTSLSLEVIFFHGLERGGYSEAYVETWTSFLDSTFICWPKTLLAEDFRRARILSVSYDSCIAKGPEQGNLDLYLTAENLVQDLIDHAKVAASPGFPVILVGKDLGGLVIKAICMEAKAQNRFTFLSNLKGIFYYRTPHLGIENLPTAFNGALAERLAFGNKEIARLGSNFSNYRRNKWATRAIISLQKSEKVPELVISEASQRYDVDECYTPKESIDTVCKNQARTSSSFRFLTNFISRIERGEHLFQSSPDQGQTEEGAGFRTSLGFEDDANYVPMQTTLAEAKNALQNARIVVLHGDPGSGKSSLARYLALEFEVVAQQQGVGVVATFSGEQSCWLPNGVVYMTCGNGADIINMQRELLRKFDIEVSDKSIALEGVELRKMLHQELVNHLSKLQFRVVIVLDDVWDDHLVEGLLVTGDQVRYLLTTQIPTLWNAHDLTRVKMQDVTLEDARHILGNYANFQDGVISKDLEDLADEIIAATGSHPLALATLGVVLDNMERTVEDWQDLKDNLKEHLKTEDYRPSSFGQKYPLSINASMMLVFDLLDEDAKKLLYKITLFDGSFIPETLLRLFLMYTLPRDEMMNISKPKMSLVAKGLVRITTSVFGKSKINNGEDFDMRVIRIHSLRQHFILTTKKEEISRITDFLDDYSDHNFLYLWEESNLELATALCALYGVADIKKRALQRMGSLIWSEEYSRGLALALRPFVSLMLSEGDTKNPISQAAAEVFLKYVRERKLDGDKISDLLKSTDYPSAPLATLSALGDIFSMEEINLIDEGHLSFLNVIPSHLDSHDDVYRRIQEKSPSEAPLIQEYAARALHNVCQKTVQEKSTSLVLNFPNVLTVSVGLIQRGLAEPTDQSRLFAASAAASLNHLARGESNITKSKICDAEGVLAALVQSLSAHDNHPLQQWAAWALELLAEGDVDIISKMCNAKGILSGLVQSLSAHDNHLLQEGAAFALAQLARGDEVTKLNICNEEGALSGLVRILSDRDNPPLQKSAARTLQNLSLNVKSARKICDEPGSLAALVQSISESTNPALQTAAVYALGNLAGTVVDFASEIFNAEGALSRLVKLLFEDDNAEMQEAAATALMNLALHDKTGELKVANEKGAIEGLLRAMSQHDKPVLQEMAVRALRNLAGDDFNTKSKISNEEGALSGLVRSLAERDNPSLQTEAAWALQSLAADVRSARKILDEPGSLAAFVQCFSERKNPALQIAAALILANLASKGVDFASEICNAEGALSGLVKLLFEEDNADVQKAAAGAFMNLASTGETVRLKVANEKGAIEGLLRAMSQHDKPVLQETAIRALRYLAMVAGESIKIIIAQEEGAVAHLKICSEHEDPKLRESASGLLAMLFRFSCDSCRITIVGTRFNSTKKHNWDLCADCFEKAPDQADYTQIK